MRYIPSLLPRNHPSFPMRPYTSILLLLLCVACTHTIPESKPVTETPVIFPDYAEVTIPPNIAPLPFALTTPHTEAYAVFTTAGETVQVKERGGQFAIPPSRWKKLLKAAAGETIGVTLYADAGGWIAYPPFRIHVADSPIDPYIAYRLIEPGYEVWNRMGIYQRNLGNWEESPIMENRLTDHNCMNCHAFCMQNPEKLLFHMREKNTGTYLIDGDRVEKLNTKTGQTTSPLVYPSWHPGGRYVAFSVNQTRQGFHQNDPNRVEVFDLESDVVVYDTEKHTIVTAPSLFAKEAFETFPTFSPDGRTLYFCSAKAVSMPEQFTHVRYSLCSIPFDPQTGSFGAAVDTLYHAETEGKSVSFPRVSPDGKYLLYTLSGYGNFSIWHRDADLYMINLGTGVRYPLEAANSDNVESYHSWSSNSRWIVFSSRRIDGLYTRPYFAYIDDNGQAAKPFLLPQKDNAFYSRFLKSYNIPEFITGKVHTDMRQLSQLAREDKGTDVTFAW